MMRGQEFSIYGLALTPNAERASKQRAIHALKLWENQIAQTGYVIDAVTGSYVNPNKNPRLGIYPSTMRYVEALKGDCAKHNGPVTYPSDFDLIIRSRSTFPLKNIKDTIIGLSQRVYQQTGILINADFPDPILSPYTLPVRDLINKLSG